MGALTYLREFHFVSVIFRLCIAMLAGGLVGLERENKGRPAGFRTYMLTSLGAALTMLICLYVYHQMFGPWDAIRKEIGITMDVSRLSAQVINGIGFLGAGTIIVSAMQQVRGLTTAAGLLASACMGLAAGAGFYECILLAFLFIILVIKLFEPVEVWIQNTSHDLNLYIEFASFDSLSEIIANMKAQDVQIFSVDLDRKEKNRFHRQSGVFSIYQNVKQPHSVLLSKLAELDCIYYIEEV